VRYLVRDIREESMIRLPGPARLRFFRIFRRRAGGEEARVLNHEEPHMKTDPRGRPIMLLPRLMPYDVYFLHNPDGYYRHP